MRIRTVMSMALPAAFALAAATQAQITARAAEPCAAAPKPAPSAALRQDLPILQAHTYRMAGRVRPLLFWISQKNVGSGVIVWRGGDGAAAFELLIGTDPAIAPRGINRWGYIVEDSRAGATHVFALMTTDAEARMSEVRARTGGEQAARGRFKAIDARVDAGAVCAATGTIETERDLPLQEVSGLVRHVRDRLTGVTPYDGALPAGARPGFLSAVNELMQDTISARRAGPAALARVRGRTLGYVHGPFTLDMTLVDVDASDATTLPAGFDGQAPIHASFELRSRATGERYRFEIDYATTGPLAGVPLVIRYQPRWWLQVELTLEQDRAKIAGLQRTGALSAAWTNATARRP